MMAFFFLFWFTYTDKNKMENRNIKFAGFIAILLLILTCFVACLYYFTFNYGVKAAISGCVGVIIWMMLWLVYVPNFLMIEFDDYQVVEKSRIIKTVKTVIGYSVQRRCFYGINNESGWEHITTVDTEAQANSIMNNLKKGVPLYQDNITTVMDKPANEDKLKKAIESFTKQIEKLSQEEIDELLKKYNPEHYS